MTDEEWRFVIPLSEDGGVSFNLTSFDRAKLFQWEGRAVDSVRPWAVIGNPRSGDEELLIRRKFDLTPRDTEDRLRRVCEWRSEEDRAAGFGELGATCADEEGVWIIRGMSPTSGPIAGQSFGPSVTLAWAKVSFLSAQPSVVTVAGGALDVDSFDAAQPALKI